MCSLRKTSVCLNSSRATESTTSLLVVEKIRYKLEELSQKYFPDLVSSESLIFINYCFSCKKIMPLYCLVESQIKTFDSFKFKGTT